MLRPLSSEEVKQRFSLHNDIPFENRAKGEMYWINHIGDKCVTVENKYIVEE